MGQGSVLEVWPRACFFSQDILAGMDYWVIRLLWQQGGGIKEHRIAKRDVVFVSQESLIVGYVSIGEPAVWGLPDHTFQSVRGSKNDFLSQSQFVSIPDK